jgi:hypothetical protein
MTQLSDRIRAIIDANVPPSMRDYYYRMVQKESSGNPSQSSSTGASGLLQFTRGTGKLYGLLGQGFDKRTDPEANIKAGVQLTEDNRNLMRKRLGREPTYSELALAHQQGAETATKMISGTGNAPRANLMVNNVPAQASGPEAARHIMNYYGFDNKKPPMGMSLAYNPLLGQLQNPVPTAPSPLPVLPPDQAQSVQAAMGAPAPAAAPPETSMWEGIKAKLLGTDGKGGKDSPIGGLEDIARGFSNRPSAAAQVEAAKISPMSPGLDTAGSGGVAAQSLLSQLLQARRKNYGLTLNGGMP